MTFDAFCKLAQTPRGAENVLIEDLEYFLSDIEENGFWITRLETSEIRDDREIPRLQLGIIGLDGDENWEAHRNHQRHFRLVKEKLCAARATGLPLTFCVWIEPRS